MSSQVWACTPVLFFVANAVKVGTYQLIEHRAHRQVRHLARVERHVTQRDLLGFKLNRAPFAEGDGNITKNRETDMRHCKNERSVEIAGVFRGANRWSRPRNEGLMEHE